MTTLALWFINHKLLLDKYYHRHFGFYSASGLPSENLLDVLRHLFSLHLSHGEIHQTQKLSHDKQLHFRQSAPIHGLKMLEFVLLSTEKRKLSIFS